MDIRELYYMNRDVERPPVADILEGNETPAGTGDQTLEITTEKGNLYQIIGITIVANTNQTLGDTEIKDAGDNVVGTIKTTQSGAGDDVTWVEDGTNKGVIARHGDVYVVGGDTIVINYSQATAAQEITARIDVRKFPLRDH